MTGLDVLSWVIGLANPISAALVGPAFAAALTRRGLARWTIRAQATGWLVLAIAQCAFLTFGYASGYAGFQYAQPLMIPVAAINYLAWLLPHRRAPHDPPPPPRQPPRR